MPIFPIFDSVIMLGLVGILNNLVCLYMHNIPMPASCILCSLMLCCVAIDPSRHIACVWALMVKSLLKFPEVNLFYLWKLFKPEATFLKKVPICFSSNLKMVSKKESSFRGELVGNSAPIPKLLKTKISFSFPLNISERILVSIVPRF